MISEAFVTKVLTEPVELGLRGGDSSIAVYPRKKAARVADPLHALYLEYNRRRKVDARKGCHRITWMEALAEIGIKSKEDAQRYVEAWKAAHEEA